MRSVHIPGLGRLFALVALVAICLAGCTGGDSDLRQWVAQKKAEKGSPIPPLPVLKTFETYVYNDQDLRDPFGPSVEEQRQEQAANTARPDQHPQEPLEKYPLDSLKMVGTIGTGKTEEGLIKDPDGVIHRVHADNYLGQNYGKITEVGEDHIDIVELVPNGTGGWIKHQATIALGEQ